jgi:glutaredoxin 3
MATVVIYTKDHCPYCDWAKQLLDLDADKLAEMIQLSSRRTVPQIFINNQPIGGYDDLSELAKTGKLDQLLA